MSQSRIYTTGIILVLLGLMAIFQIACQMDGTGGTGNDLSHEQGEGSSLQLSVLENSGSDQTVDLAIHYYRHATSSAPRVMELFVRHSDSLEFLNASKEQALTITGKELVVQRKSNTLLRVVAYSSSNLNPLDTGHLATLKFRTNATGSHQIEILAERPVFAPTEANDGLLIGGPLHIHLD